MARICPATKKFSVKDYYGIDNVCRKFWDKGNPLTEYVTDAYPCKIPEEAKKKDASVSRLCLGYFLNETLLKEKNGCVLYSGSPHRCSI